MKQKGSTFFAAQRFSRLFLFLAALVLMVSMALTACAPQVAVSATEPATAAEPGTAAPQNEISDIDSLIAALENRGASVERGGMIEDSFFSAGGIFLKVNGQDVQVFEFADAAAQQAAAGTIEANGYIIGTAAIDWLSQPYFFSAGNLIVLYVGQDNETISLLHDLLGQPLTR